MRQLTGPMVKSNKLLMKDNVTFETQYDMSYLVETTKQFKDDVNDKTSRRDKITSMYFNNVKMFADMINKDARKLKCPNLNETDISTLQYAIDKRRNRSRSGNVPNFYSVLFSLTPRSRDCGHVDAAELTSMSSNVMLHARYDNNNKRNFGEILFVPY